MDYQDCSDLQTSSAECAVLFGLGVEYLPPLLLWAGRGQHQQPTAGAAQRNGTKGQVAASDPVPHLHQRSHLSVSPADTFPGIGRRTARRRKPRDGARFRERKRCHVALWDIVPASMLSAPAYLLAMQRDAITIRLPGTLARAVRLGGRFV